MELEYYHLMFKIIFKYLYQYGLYIDHYLNLKFFYFIFIHFIF